MLENEHLFMTVRTSRAYLCFNVLQLALTFGLLLCFFWLVTLFRTARGVASGAIFQPHP